MHGCDNTFRLSSTVSRFSYISGVVNIQRAGPEVRLTSQLFVLLLRASLQRLPRSKLQEGMGVKGVTLPLPRAVDTDRANLLLNLLMDHCYLKLHVSKKNTTGFGSYAESHSVVGPPTWTHSGAQLFHIVFRRAIFSPSQNHFYNRAISWYASSA